MSFAIASRSSDIGFSVRMRTSAMVTFSRSSIAVDQAEDQRSIIVSDLAMIRSA